MRRNLVLVVLLVLAVWGCKNAPSKDEQRAEPGASKEQPPSELPRPGEQPVPKDVGSAIGPTEADIVAPEPDVDGGSAGDLTGMPSLSSLTWSLTPGQLDVMRPTEVEFLARWEGVDEGSYRCQWDPGDRTGKQLGCRLKHVYETGLADRTVTLRILFGGQIVLTESRPLPLERLPVTELPSDESSVPPPEADVKSVRVLLWSAFAAPSQKDVDALRKALRASDAKHAILFFNMLVDASATRGLVDSLQQETGVSFLPLFCAGLEGEGSWKLPRAFVPHGPENEIPFRHAAMADGIGYVVLDGRVSKNDVTQEKWVLERLQEMRIAAHRVVLSCRPMESLTGEASELTPQFRYYEKLLRGDVSALVSSGDPVFYHGRYGDLTAVFAGCATGAPGIIAGQTKRQEPTMGVLDLQPGKKTTAWSLSVADPAAMIKSSEYPRQVGNYDRKL